MLDDNHVHECRRIAVRVADHFGEVIDLSWFGFGNVAVNELAVAMLVHPGPTLFVPWVKNVSILAPRNLLLANEVERNRRVERRPVTDVHEILPPFQVDHRDYVDVGFGHVGAAKIYVVTTVAQELREVGVVGVAGAAEVESFLAVEVLLEARDE